jgi:hypothetical protein
MKTKKHYHISEARYSPEIDNCKEKTIASFVSLNDAMKLFHDMAKERPVYLWHSPFFPLGDTGEIAWSSLYNNEYSKIHG